MENSLNILKDIEHPEGYRRLVGKLNSRTMAYPDIAHFVIVSSQKVHHWAALEQILCYLKGAPRCGILHANYGHTHIECFSDADWQVPQ